MAGKRKGMFVDTGGWYALVREDDIFHEQAKEAFINFKGRIITSDFIVSETVSLLQRRVGVEIAIQLAKRLFDPRLTKIIYFNRSLFIKLGREFVKPHSRDLSFVDISSRIAIQEHKIDRVLAFDKHLPPSGRI